jgi:hypothetical protein
VSRRACPWHPLRWALEAPSRVGHQHEKCVHCTRFGGRNAEGGARSKMQVFEICARGCVCACQCPLRPGAKGGKGGTSYGRGMGIEATERPQLPPMPAIALVLYIS